MKKNISAFIAVIMCSIVYAQQKSFEGYVVYRTEVKSKSEIVSDQAMKNLLAMGNQSTVFIKEGNYKQIYGPVTTYYVAKDQKAYNKFNNIDTLYYVDYSSDSSVIKKIIRSNEKMSIAGFDCKSVTIETNDATRKYFYAPALYYDPGYDKNNTLDVYNVYIKETSSIYLGYSLENKTFIISTTGLKVKQTPVADSVFELPNLPKKKFVADELITPPEFTRPGGFEKYIQSSIDKDVAPKYLKLRKGQESVSQQVIVRFLVNEYGRVAFADIENKKDVNSKLAEEALRVVNASPLWKPAIAYKSEKVAYWMKIPIQFIVTK